MGQMRVSPFTRSGRAPAPGAVMSAPVFSGRMARICTRSTSPGSAPSTTIGPVAGFTCEKLSRAFGCPSSVTCPLKQSQVSTVSEQGAVTVATGSETPKL